MTAPVSGSLGRSDSRRGRRFLLGCLCILVMALLTGCGVYRSTIALQSARLSYEKAQAAGASRLAVYEYTLGVEFLKKAREEVGYADYSTGEKLANQAESYLKKAAKKARAQAGEPVEKEPAAAQESSDGEERALDGSDEAPPPTKKKKSKKRRAASEEAPEPTAAPEEGLQPEEEDLP